MKNLHVYILVALLGIGCGRYNKKTLEPEKKNCWLSGCCGEFWGRICGGDDNKKSHNPIKYDDDENRKIEAAEFSNLTKEFKKLRGKCENIMIPDDDAYISKMIGSTDERVNFKDSAYYNKYCNNTKTLKELAESCRDYVIEKDIKKANSMLDHLNKFLKGKIEEKKAEKEKFKNLSLKYDDLLSQCGTLGINNNNNNGGVEDKDTKEQTYLNIEYRSLLNECEMLEIKCNDSIIDEITEQTSLNIECCRLLNECEILGIKCNDSIIDEMISAEDGSSINWYRPNNCENLNLKEQVESYMYCVFVYEEDMKITNRILANLNKLLKGKIQEKKK